MPRDAERPLGSGSSIVLLFCLWTLGGPRDRVDEMAVNDPS